MICSTVYGDCSVCIDDTVISTNLIPLEIRHFDVIFEKDWLSKNWAMFHYPNKCVTFRNLERKEVQFEGDRINILLYFVSMACAQRILRKGCWEYLCSVVSFSLENFSTIDILVVCDFLKVFPEELPRFVQDFSKIAVSLIELTRKENHSFGQRNVNEAFKI